MEQSSSVPVAVKSVAAWFSVVGCLALVDAIWRFTDGDIGGRTIQQLVIAAFSLYAAVGLLLRSSSARTCALWLIRIALFAIATLTIVLLASLLLASPRTPKFRFLGHLLEAPKAVLFGAFVVAFAIFLWQDWLLRRPAIRKLFGQDQEND